VRIRLYRHELNADQTVQLDRAVSAFHDAQDQIGLVDAGRRVLPSCRGLVDFTCDIAPSRAGAMPEITATGFRLSDNWFTHTRGGCAVMTLMDWQIAFLGNLGDHRDDLDELPPFPTAAPDAYLLQSLTLATFFLATRAIDYDYVHDATTGCIADLCADKRTRAIKMRAGYVCPRCIAKASAAGVSPVVLDAIHALAERVRALAIGRRPQSTAAPTRLDDSEWIDRATLPRWDPGSCGSR
jgi:hypothetical protein